MSEYRLLPAGDTALVVEFGDSIDRRVSAKVLALARRLDDAALDGIIEAVPTFRSLMVHYDPLVLSTSALSAHIAEWRKARRRTNDRDACGGCRRVTTRAWRPTSTRSRRGQASRQVR